MLMHVLRWLALKGTDLERAQCPTIRLNLLKIGVQIHVTVRRVCSALPQVYPYQDVFEQAFDNLQTVLLQT
jgi:hypothetical protein